MYKRIILFSLIALSCHGAGGLVTPTISGGGGSGHGGSATNLTPWPSDINGAGFSLSNVANIKANFFYGDGSGLTGIAASNVIAQTSGIGTNTALKTPTFTAPATIGITTLSDSNATIRLTGGGSITLSNTSNRRTVGMDPNGAWIVNGKTVNSTNSLLFLEQFPVQTNAALGSSSVQMYGWYTWYGLGGYFYYPTNIDPTAPSSTIYKTNFSAGVDVYVAYDAANLIQIAYWATNGVDGWFPNLTWHPDPSYFIFISPVNTNVARSYMVQESMAASAERANEAFRIHEATLTPPYNGGFPISQLAQFPATGIILTNTVTFLTNNLLQGIVDVIEIDRWTVKRNSNGDQIFNSAAYGDLTLAKYANYLHANGFKAALHEDYGNFDMSSGTTDPAITGSYPYYHQDATNLVANGIDYVAIDTTAFPPVGQPHAVNYFLQFLREFREASVTWDHPVFVQGALNGSFGSIGFQDWFTACDVYNWVADVGTDTEYLKLIKQSTGYRGHGKYPIMVNPDDTTFTASAITARKLGCFMAMGPCSIQWLNTNNLTSFTVGVQTNNEFRAIWHDSAMNPGWQVSSNSTTAAEVWARPLANGDIAVFMLNRGTPSTITVSWNDLKIAPSNTVLRCRDIFERTNVFAASSLSRVMAANEGAIWTLSAGISTNAIDPTFYTLVTSGVSGSSTNAIANNNGSGTNTALYGTTSFIGVGDTNAILSAPGGGTINFTNPVTTKAVIIDPNAVITATAYLIPTNSAPSHVILIGESDFSTNASYAYTSVSGIVGKDYSFGVQHVTNSLNALIAITPATEWHAQGVWNCTNESVISVSVIPGRTTNAICYPQW